MEQGNDIPSVIEEVFKRYTDGSYIKASMLPDLDLYVDQITTFLTRHLAKTIRFEDDQDHDQDHDQQLHEESSAAASGQEEVFQRPYSSDDLYLLF